MPLKKYISPEAFENLGKHKHHCIDDSFLDPLLQPFWNWAVTLLPMTMAPNIVSILAIVGVLVSLAITMALSPSMQDELPPWTQLMAALSVWLFQTFDALDGLQARRTGSSSPLGDLVDHSIDTLSIGVSIQTIMTSILLGPGWIALYVQIAAFSMHFSVLWNTRHTGDLYLGVFSITEAQFLLIGLHVVTFFTGGAWWLTPGFLGLRYNDWVALICATGVVAGSWITNVLRVIENVRGRGKAVRPALMEVAPMAILVALTVVWLILSPVHALYTHPRLVLCSILLVGLNMCSYMILSYCTHTPFKAFNTLLIPLCALVLNALVGGILQEQILLWAYSFLALGAQLHLWYGVAMEITAFSGIGVFDMVNKECKKGT